MKAGVFFYTILMSKPKIIAIVGPTASGKSALGTYLAKKFNGEIISADSRQIYKGMGIISRATPGYMVGVADPRRPYSAGEFARDAKEAIKKIMIYHKIPIVVGGAGFYVDALLSAPLPAVAPNKKLRKKLAKKSLTQLFAMLKKLDTKSAKRVDPQNKVRLIRAIEIAKALGKVPNLVSKTSYNVLWLGLALSEQKLKRNIRIGLFARIKAGMIAEAKKLRTKLPRKRFLSFGFEFQLLADYLDGKIPRLNLGTKLIQEEIKYAKRQMRWFRRNKDIHWIKNKTEAVQLTRKFLGGR